MNWCVPEDSAFEWGQALNVKGEMSQDGGACHKSSSMHNGAMAFLTFLKNSGNFVKDFSYKYVLARRRVPYEN